MASEIQHQIPCFKDLIAVLVECFLIISLGYLSSRFKLISKQAKDLNSYLSTFALPMVIFLNIAQMEFHTINISFLICMLIAKFILFFTVTVLTLTVNHPSNTGYCGALAILCTQSNDFALGYPLIKSLYGENKPEMLNYLSLMAPIQLLILNPLGIMMLEYNKSRIASKRANKRQDKNSSKNITASRTRSDTSVESETRKNNDATSNSVAHRNKTTAHQEAATGVQQRTLANICAGCCTAHAPTPQVTPMYEHCPERYESASGRLHNGDQLGAIYDEHGHSPTSTRQLIHTRSCSPDNTDGSSSDELATNRYDVARYGSRGAFVRRTKSLRIVLRSNPEVELEQTADETNLVDYDQSPEKMSQCTRQRHDRVREQQLNPIDESNLQHASGVDQKCMCEHPDCECLALRRSKSSLTKSTIDFRFLSALATNPLIIASVVALMVNLINGPELPKFVTRVSNTIAASFSAPALFVVGISMSGKFKMLLNNPDNFLLAMVLVMAKIVILPNLMRTLALLILPTHTAPEELPYLVDFSFLYGLLPTAPTACIIANQYGILPNVVSTAMILSTFISAPLMLLASSIINYSLTTDEAVYVKLMKYVVAQTVKYSSITTFTFVTLTLYSIWRVKYASSITRQLEVFKLKSMQALLVMLALSQALLGFGGLFWFMIGDNDENDGNPSVKLESELVAVGGVGLIEPDLAIMAADPVESFKVLAAGEHGSSGILVSTHYVFCSFGLMLSRFAIMCMIFRIAENTFKDWTALKRISLSVIRLYSIMATVITFWLIFESSQTKHEPGDSSVPNGTIALWVRLIYNTVFLIISVPLFAIILNARNRAKYLYADRRSKLLQISRGDSIDSTPSDNDTSYRLFVTSCASLSSATSSALTSNTHIDTCTRAGRSAGLVNPAYAQMDNNNNSANNNNINNSPVHVQGGEPLEVILSCNSNCDIATEQKANVDRSKSLSKKSISIAELKRKGLSNCKRLDEINSRSSSSNLNTYGTTSSRAQLSALENPAIGFTNSEDNLGQSSRSVVEADSQIHLLPSDEFQKHSIVIAFMLVASLHNLTCLTQKLLYNGTFGTYRQTEIINIALEFGQGFVTFLIYGLNKLRPR